MTSTRYCGTRSRRDCSATAIQSACAKIVPERLTRPDVATRMTKLSDLGPPVPGKLHGGQHIEEHLHFYNCPHCGQRVDQRDLRQVFGMNGLVMNRWSRSLRRRRSNFQSGMRKTRRREPAGLEHIRLISGDRWRWRRYRWTGASRYKRKSFALGQNGLLVSFHRADHVLLRPDTMTTWAAMLPRRSRFFSSGFSYVFFTVVLLALPSGGKVPCVRAVCQQQACPVRGKLIYSFSTGTEGPGPIAVTAERRSRLVRTGL